MNTDIENLEIGDIGLINSRVTNTLPSNVRIADGRELSRAGYFRLYRLIGTRYGKGDGVNTFNIPDLRPAPESLEAIARMYDNEPPQWVPVIRVS